jgi:hypothetical protein
VAASATSRGSVMVVYFTPAPSAVMLLPHVWQINNFMLFAHAFSLELL